MSYSATTTTWSTAPNKVLRNTYALLALSMVPTAAGAILGLSTQLGAALFSGWMGALLSLAVMFGLIFGIQANKNSGVGVVLLGILTFVMGVMLSGTLSYTMRFANGTAILVQALSMTGIVLAGMAVLSSVVKRSLSGLASTLFIGVLLLLGVGIVNLFVQSSALGLTLSAASAGIFSLYILVDLKAVRDGYETSYISAALSVYLDLFNLFTSLLKILTALTGED